MKNLGCCLMTSLLSFIFVACDGGSSSDDGNPLRSGNGDEFYCKVTRNGGNLEQVANIPGECEAFAEIVDNGDGTSLMSTEMTVYGKSAEEYESICDSLSEMSDVFVPGSYQCKNGYFKFKILVDNNKINLDEVERNAKIECENNEVEYKEKSQSGNSPVESSESNSDFGSSSFSSPEGSGFKNSFTCDVSKEGDNIVQRMNLNEFGIIEKSTLTFAPGAEAWAVSAELLFDGVAAESMAADMCEEYKSEGEVENVVCTENKVSFSMNIGDVDDSAKLMSALQAECDEMESDYNGLDFDGPRETRSEVPTSCKVTDGESSLTLNIVYSDWAFLSTVTFSGSKSHEVDLYSGNYGDWAEKQCAFEKSEGGTVVCDGPSITLDDDWNMEFSLDEMKSFSQYACNLLLDGTMSFEELVMTE